MDIGHPVNTGHRLHKGHHEDKGHHEKNGHHVDRVDQIALPVKALVHKSKVLYKKEI